MDRPDMLVEKHNSASAFFAFAGGFAGNYSKKPILESRQGSTAKLVKGWLPLTIPLVKGLERRQTSIEKFGMTHV